MKSPFIKTTGSRVALVACILAGTAWDKTAAQPLRLGIGPTKIGKSLAEDMQRRGKTIEMGRVTEALDGQFTSAFVGIGKFTVIARTDLQTLLDREQGLPAGAVVDPETAAKSGKIKGLQNMVVISVDSFLDEQTKMSSPALGVESIKRRLQLSCVANIYDCSTGEISASPNFQSELVDTTDVLQSESGNKGDRLDELMVKVARLAAEKAAHRVTDVLYPAKIMDVEGATLTINRGESLGIKTEQMWDLYGPSKEVRDPDTGKVKKIKGKKIGSVRIKSVDADSAQGELVGPAASPVAVGCVLTLPTEASPKQ